MDIKKLVNKQGVCPFCGHDNLVYNAIEIEGDMAYFPWRCERCGHQGEEWYEFIFMGHNVEDEDGNMMELPHEDDEWGDED